MASPIAYDIWYMKRDLLGKTEELRPNIETCHTTKKYTHYTSNFLQASLPIQGRLEHIHHCLSAD